MRVDRAPNLATRRLGWLAVAGVLALAAAGLLLAALAQAGPALAHAPAAEPAVPNVTLVVTNTNNMGVGSLRRAIHNANQLYTGTHDLIVFDLTGCPCVINLQNSLPTITEPLTIKGPGAELLAINGGGSHLVFEVSDNASLSLSSLTIQNGYSSRGGAAINAEGPVTLTHVYVLSNTADSVGGAMDTTADLVIVGGLFQGNTAGNHAGAIGAVDSTVTLSGTAFISNTANGWGGAIMADTLLATGAHFERNVAAGDGGAVRAITLVLTDSVFIGNEATGNGYGGAIYAEGVGEITGGWFETNAAQTGGGLYGYSLVLTDTVVLSNTAVFYGGGAYGVATATRGGRFEGNVAHSDAGGLGGSYLVLSGTEFLNNRAVFNGGGLYIEGASTLRRVRLEGNYAGSFGGGLYANFPLTLTDSAVVGNVAEAVAGAYIFRGIVENVLFAGNTATDTLTGSAVHISGAGDTRLVHVTVAGPATPGARAIMLANGEAYVTNTIVAGYPVGLSRLLGAGGLSEDYNLFFNVAEPISGTVNSGGNSFTGDPDFADPAGGNYHLGPNSEALNAGTNAGLDTDYDGDPRPLDSGYDIGFDEASFIAGLAATHAPEPALAGETVTFTATVTAGQGVSYTWDFDDGSLPQTGSSVTHTFAAAGEYNVTVTASNASGSAQAVTEVHVTAPGWKLYLPAVVR